MLTNLLHDPVNHNHGSFRVMRPRKYLQMFVLPRKRFIEELGVTFVDESVSISAHKDHIGILFYFFDCFQDVQMFDIVLARFFDVLS